MTSSPVDSRDSHDSQGDSDGGDARRILADIESVPLDEQLTVLTTYGLLRQAAADRGSAPALIFLPTGADDDVPLTWSYDELLGQIHALANGLHGLGVEADGAVSLLLPHLPQTHAAFWAAETVGIVNPINFLLRSEEIADLMRAAGTKVLIAAGPHPLLDIWPKALEAARQVPSITHVVQVPLTPPSGDDAETELRDGLQVLQLAALGADQPRDRCLFDPPTDGERTAAFFHTGGTTGSPKLARHTHYNQAFSAWAYGRLFDLDGDDVVLNGLPLFHVAGALVCGLAPLAAGSTVVILSPAGLRSPTVVENYWRIAERYRGTIVGGVPTTLGALNQVPLGDADLSSSDCAITGASPLPLDVGRRFEQHSGLPLHQIYGMTESAGLAAVVPRGCRDTEDDGGLSITGYRLPFTRLEVRRLVDGKASCSPDDGERLCAIGEPGMVVLSGPCVFPGYMDPRHNEGAFTDDGFLITGDLGHRRADGGIVLTGRAKDVIIRGGHNIDPTWIEDAASEHEDVDQAVAVGRPDAYAGEIPVLFVTAMEGRSIDTEALQTFVTERIAERPARPQSITVLDAVPLTAVGKPFRPELRRRAAEAHLRGLWTEHGADGDGLRVELDAGGLHVIVSEEPTDDQRELLEGHTLRWKRT